VRSVRRHQARWRRLSNAMAAREASETKRTFPREIAEGANYDRREEIEIHGESPVIAASATSVSPIMTSTPGRYPRFDRGMGREELKRLARKEGGIAEGLVAPA